MVFLLSKFYYCVFKCLYTCKSSVRATPPVCGQGPRMWSWFSPSPLLNEVSYFPVLQTPGQFKGESISPPISWRCAEQCSVSPRGADYPSSNYQEPAPRPKEFLLELTGIVIQQLVSLRHIYRGGLHHAGLYDGLFEKLALFSQVDAHSWGQYVRISSSHSLSAFLLLEKL